MTTSANDKTAKNNAPVTFVVTGQPMSESTTRGAGAAGASVLPAGEVRVSLRIGNTRSGASTQQVQVVPGQDVVALHIAGGPVLYLHPHHARDLMLAQQRQTLRGAPPASVVVPAELGWPGLEPAGATRGIGGGWASRVLLTAFQVITGGAAAMKDSAADLAASAVVAKVDGQVDAGVYLLSPDALPALKGSGRKLAAVPAAVEPMLVLLHGTFVDTVSTFGKLWTQFPQATRDLFAHYGGRVYALDHPTLGAGPIANALTLVQALPTGARLHLASHSRGGLVAEVLARVAGQRVGSADLAFFQGPAHATQRAQLQALAQQVQAKGIRVERVLRVACPARGTLLASKRLDAYLSVLAWALQLTGLPLLPALLDFITEVARRRADPAQLPGLEAMLPDSPLVRWLNAGEPIAGELRVVAGDMQGDSIGSWLKTLLADAYYYTDNDVVVQTRSMYGGAPRLGGASYLLDRGGKVNHFSYFVNERTVQALMAGLMQPQPAGFEPIGPLSWAGQDSSGRRGAARGDPSSAAAKPAVFVLPGILSSNLAVEDKRIWLSLRLVGGLGQLRYRQGVADGVRPDGPIALVYDKLIEHLGATHEVIPFAYDWRRPIEDEARRLADAVEQALAARQSSGQPVRLLAHSMGGVLARTMQLERPETFARLMALDGARFVMLGTPNGGSWAPMQVLSGDDTFGNALAVFGSPMANQGARQLMAEMPGFMQLQAELADPAHALSQQATWQRLAEQDLAAVRQINSWHRYGGESEEAAYEWGVPTQAVLDQALALRRKLDVQRDTVLPSFAAKTCLVVGQAPRTPVGFELGQSGLDYLDAGDGDGRVPLRSALLPGVRTWLLRVSHGDLPSEQSAFDAFVDLLQTGETVRLASFDTTPRGAPRGDGRSEARAEAAPLQRSRPSRRPSAARPAGGEASVFDTPQEEALPAAAGTAEAAGAPLQLRVLNGNLSFVAQALLLGHYRSAALSGTEAVVNRLVGGSMATALAAGLYPEALGTQQIFLNTQRDALNPWRPPSPRSVVVVGLGEEGALHEAGIASAVRQGALAWSMRAAEDPAQAGAELELAATLLGSGGIGITAAAAAGAAARGVHEANQRLQSGGWPRIQRLTLVELYLDRASEAWQSLRLLCGASPQAYTLIDSIQFGTGALRRRLDGGYRGADYDLISITQGARADSLAFAVDTRRARTEVRAQMTQGTLVREMVSRAASDTNTDAQIGHTLFQLLVPVEMEPYLGGTDRVVLELDAATAPIPWELLDTGAAGRGGDVRPWALRTQLLRRLRKEQFRSQPRDANADDAVLVIGEPLAPADYPPLPGALAEAESVVAQLTGAGGLDASRVSALLGHADAGTVIGALLQRPWRVVHIAGHGEPPRDVDGGGGVVLSGGHFLGPREIESMRTVPELVFVNCCHLAAFGSGQVLKTPNPAAFAAGVADQLISIGVRCVVAAGWAVEDGPAEQFATTFYRELLAGRRFMAAVAAAREAAWAANPAGSTWAAYQCYGDPDWAWRTGTGDAQSPVTAAFAEFDSIASPVALALALEELVTRSRYMGAARQSQRDRLQHLESRFAAPWGDAGAVAEAFGLAWLAVDEHARAMAWYERALSSNDGSATQRALEQLLNLRARKALADVRQAGSGGAELQRGRAEIEAALAELRPLAQRRPTIERLSLLGSALKRLGMLEAIAGRASAETRALTQALQAYQQAEMLARSHLDPGMFYPALNRMAIEQVLAAQRGKASTWDAGAAAHVRANLLDLQRRAPDFWNHVGLVELGMYEALALGQLAARLPAISAGYEDIARRVTAPWLWASASDQAGFVLGAVAAGGSGATANAARALLAQLALLAQRGDAALSTAPPPALAATVPPRRERAASPPVPADEVAYDAVIWHAPSELPLARQLAQALTQEHQRVWLRSAVAPGRDATAALRRALGQARLALVVPGSAGAEDEATLREWSLLQAAMWRGGHPTWLATVVPGRARVPPFLLDQPSVSAKTVAREGASAVVKRLLAEAQAS